MTPERFDAIVAELKAALVALPGESPRPTPIPHTPPAQPIVTPPMQRPIDWGDNWMIEAAEQATAQGFDRCLVHEWDWSSAVSHIDTQAMGGIGDHGVLVISFVPTHPADHDNLSFVDAIGYPSPQAGRQFTATISLAPVDFTDVVGPNRSTGEAPTLPYGVGTVTKPWFSPAREAALVPGLRYFLNVAGIDVNNRFTFDPSAHGTSELRVHFRKPNGH